MDPRIHPLTTVTKLIDKMRPADDGVYSLYVEHHELHICRYKLVPKDAPEISRITALDINTGLTTKHWSYIETIIRTLVRKGVIEWHHQKPSPPKSRKNSSTKSSGKADEANHHPRESGTTQSLY